MNAYQDHKAGPVTFGGIYYDAFVAKLSPTGTLQYSTYLGGTIYDFATSIAVDIFNNAYVTSDGYDGFLSVFDGTGHLVYSSYFGGIASEMPSGIGPDIFGNIYITGDIDGSGLPAVNAIQPAYGGSYSDGFIVKFNRPANSLLFSTYFGGSGADHISGISVLPLGTAYIAGLTQSGDFPVRNAMQSHLAGENDAFVAKIGEPDIEPEMLSRCRFMGDGNLPGFTGADLTVLTNVAHNFQIRCSAGDLPNHIDVNWDLGNQFTLENLTYVTCMDSPDIVPKNPSASCDAISGIGTGRYNGTAGATIQFTFTDAGEPGVNDLAAIRIIDASGNVVLETNSTLTGGNQQAHGGK